MNRSVVTHHSTAWCRHHRATSRGTAGRVLRRSVGRGGQRVARATLPGVTGPLPQLQPDQNALGQPNGHGMPMTPRPPAALVLVPAQLPLGLVVKRFDRMTPMRQAGPLCQRGTVWSNSSARHSQLVTVFRSRTATSVRTATTDGSCRASKPARKFG
jgi:hypothetical protein